MDIHVPKAKKLINVGDGQLNPDLDRVALEEEGHVLFGKTAEEDRLFKEGYDQIRWSGRKHSDEESTS